jgi:hypothetical protein
MWRAILQCLFRCGPTRATFRLWINPDLSVLGRHVMTITWLLVFGIIGIVAVWAGFSNRGVGKSRTGSSGGSTSDGGGGYSGSFWGGDGGGSCGGDGGGGGGGGDGGGC